MENKSMETIRQERKNAFEAKCAELDTFIKRMIPIDVIEERDGFALVRSVNNTTGKPRFKILWDGECISLIDDEREARAMFLDFAPKPAGKRGRKAKAVA